MILRMALASLIARALTVAMTVLAIALSVMLFLGVEKVRTGAKASFADTISGTDLNVGARSGSVQLLLYSVFRIGNATNNMTWESYQDIAANDAVDWIVPISLGDSHRQFRVMGTTPAFFERYKYRSGQSLSVRDGTVMDDLFDATIGADVAETLGYSVGDPIVVAHGLASFSEHEDQPFRISAILEKTGTPVDRTVIVSLEAIEAIHVDWQSGAQIPGQSTSVDVIREMDLQPQAATAALVGVKGRLQVFGLQRAINEYPQEPLQAILPGVALQELWQIVGIAETALIAVSGMVIVTALIGMMATIFSSLNERRREMAIFRAMGARPRVIFSLLVLEAAVMAAVGAVLGLILLYLGLLVAQPMIDSAFGLWIPIDAPSLREVCVLLGVILAGAIMSRTTATTGLIKHYAVFLDSTFLEATAAAGNWGSFGNAGANINRSSFTLPVTAETEYVYVGVYAGTRTFDRRSGVELVTGDVTLLLDTADFDPNGDFEGDIVGWVDNRVRVAPGLTGGGDLPRISLVEVSYDPINGVWDDGIARTFDNDG